MSNGDAAGREPGGSSQASGSFATALLLVIPPLCWAGNFVVGRAIHADIPPATLTFWRWAVATLVLLPIAGAETWRNRAVLVRNWRMLALLAITGVICFQYFVYRGLQTTTAINGALIIATVPLAIPMLAFLLERQRIGWRHALGLAVSLIGVAVVIVRGDPGLLGQLRLTPGDGWMALAVPMWALYSVVVKRRPPDLPPLAMLLASTVIGLVLLAPVYAWDIVIRGQGVVLTVEAALAIVYVGLFASVIAFICWNRGIARIGAARTGQFIHLMPVFAALLAMVFLDERLAGFHLVGIGLIALGLLLSATAPSSGAPRRPAGGSP